MYSDHPRCIYRANQLGEVICQLRFPEILRISTDVPADFQDAIRAEFPQYTLLKEPHPPKLVGVPGNMSVQKQDPTVNYQFTSADGVWRINLTPRFIALACNRYFRWEEFARKLDKPLAAFIRIYQPTYFERIGLRYVNFISRKALDLTDVPFVRLINPQYLGLLSDEDIRENSTIHSKVDADTAIRGGCRIKLHAGPGMVRKGQQSDPEVKFVLDLDLYMPGKVPVNLSAGALQTLHAQAFPIFRGAITDTLHDALSPESI